MMRLYCGINTATDKLLQPSDPFLKLSNPLVLIVHLFYQSTDYHVQPLDLLLLLLLFLTHLSHLIDRLVSEASLLLASQGLVLGKGHRTSRRIDVSALYDLALICKDSN